MSPLKFALPLLIALAATASAARAQTVTGPALEVVVTLSPAAAARLAGRETVVVDVEYYGDPINQALRDKYEGQMDLAPEQKLELKGAGEVRFSGPMYNKSKLRLVRDGLKVAINGYSGRHSSPDNLLVCDDFDTTLAAAAAHPVAMHCKLIAEP